LANSNIAKSNIAVVQSDLAKAIKVMAGYPPGFSPSHEIPSEFSDVLNADQLFKKPAAAKKLAEISDGLPGDLILVFKGLSRLIPRILSMYGWVAKRLMPGDPFALMRMTAMPEIGNLYTTWL